MIEFRRTRYFSTAIIQEIKPGSGFSNKTDNWRTTSFIFSIRIPKMEFAISFASSIEMFVVNPRPSKQNIWQFDLLILSKLHVPQISKRSSPCLYLLGFLDTPFSKR